MTPADETRADLERLWSAIFALYRCKPAVGTLGAEAVGLALEAEDLVASDPSRAGDDTGGPRPSAGSRGAGGLMMPGGAPGSGRAMFDAGLRALHEGALLGTGTAAMLLTPAALIACALVMASGSGRSADAASLLTPAAAGAALAWWALGRATGLAIPTALVGSALAWWAALGTAGRLRENR